MPTHMWGLCTVFILGAPAPYLQQGPFVTLGALVALLLLPIYGVVDSGHGERTGPTWTCPPTSSSLLETLSSLILSDAQCLHLNPISG